MAAQLHSSMVLRRATLADAPLLHFWDTKAHIMAAVPNVGIDWEEELVKQWQAHWMAEVDGRPIGVLQVMDPAMEETHYWGDVPQHLRAVDIWIGEEAYLGKGYGTRMMELVLDTCFAAEDVTGVLIDPLASNVNAHRFYERMGFRFVEERWFAEDFCRVYMMERGDWEKQGLR